MNRREFSQILLGSGLAASIPTSAITATGGSAVQRGAYTWAVAIAHAKSQISPEMITARLKISTDNAQQLIARLAANGVVEAPNAAGFSKLSAPLLRVRSEVIVRAPGGGTTPKDVLDKLREQAKKVCDPVTEDETGAPEPDGRNAEAADPTLSDGDPARPIVSGAAHSAE